MLARSCQIILRIGLSKFFGVFCKYVPHVLHNIPQMSVNRDCCRDSCLAVDTTGITLHGIPATVTFGGHASTQYALAISVAGTDAYAWWLPLQLLACIIFLHGRYPHPQFRICHNAFAAITSKVI